MEIELLCTDCSPHHEVTMEKTQCGPDFQVDRCPRCGGIWLDKGELEKIMELGIYYITYLDDIFMIKSKKNPRRECPRCQVPLNAKRFEKMPDIELDVCPKCAGLWFDAGELRAIGKKYKQPPA
jgi:Zn-finger nucleic acid-binding protein